MNIASYCIKFRTAPINTVNLPVTMDEKTYQQYKIESRKTLLWSTATAIIVWFALTFLTYVSWDTLEIFSFLLYFPAILMGFFVYLISGLRLQKKYKIFNTCRNNNFHFSKDGYRWHSNSNDLFRDNNPTYPGTAAYHARKMRK